MLLEYLTLPQIPKELILPKDLILKQPLITSRERQDEIFYQTYEVNLELNQWLRKHIPYLVGKGMYQLIYASLPIHRDFGANQTQMSTAINYIVDTGGRNVIISMYAEDHNSVQDIRLAQDRWHKLAANHLHSVKNVSRPRIMVRLFTLFKYKDIV